MIEIRKVVPEDLGQVFLLVNDLEHGTLDIHKFKPLFEMNLANPDIHYLVAVSNDGIVGFLSVHIQSLLHHTGKVAEIQELVVKTEKRGQGVGERLADQAKQIAKENGCIILEVCTNAKREDAQRFYENKAGFAKTHFKFTLKL